MQTSFACAPSGRKPFRVRERNTMPIYHLSVKTISRSAGRSATAAAAYRAGAEIVDERTGEVHDYRRKGGVESAVLVLPTDAPEWASKRAKLWNAAEVSETRKNSTVAREFEIALPSELSAQERAKLAHDFAREIVERHGCAADVAIHAPGRGGDNRNHHAHILCTTRQLTPEGFGAKCRELDDRKTGEIDRWRERFAQLQNESLESAGVAERVDHRSLKDQGIDREPTVHLGPAASGYERRTGQPSDKRMHQEQDIAERLSKAREAGELERQGQQLEKTILDLSGDLKAAVAERDRQQRAEQEKRHQEEQQRRATEGMSAAQLAAEIARLRPLPAADVAKRQPEVAAASQAHQALLHQRQAIQADQERARQEAEAWRADHPIRAKGHDAGAWKSDYLAEREQAEASAKQQLRTLALQIDATGRKSSAAEAEAVTRINQEQAPALARIAQLETLLAERHAQEERQRAALYQEEQRQRAEQRERAERERADRERKDNIAALLACAARMHQEGQLELPKGPAGEAVGRVLQAIGTDQGAARMRQDLDDPTNAKTLEAVARTLAPQVAKQLQAERDQEERDNDNDYSR
jgi:hypothetical protein